MSGLTLRDKTKGSQIRNFRQIQQGGEPGKDPEPRRVQNLKEVLETRSSVTLQLDPF